MTWRIVLILLFVTINSTSRVDAIAAEVEAVAENPYGQLVGNIQVTTPSGKIVEFRVFDRVSPQYQAREFCALHQFEDSACTPIIQAAIDLYTSVNQIGGIKIRFGAESEVDFRVFDYINPEHYRVLFCASYFIGPDDCNSLIRSATTIRNSANIVGVVHMLLNETWAVDYRIYDHVNPDVQSDAVCSRYFLSAGYCGVIRESAREKFDSSGMVATVPLVLNDNETVDFKIYDKIDVNEAIQVFCGRYNLPLESCNAVAAAAREAVQTSSLLGVIPLNVDSDISVDFRIYDSNTADMQSANLCRRYSLTDESCAPVVAIAREVYNSANIMGVIPLVLSNTSEVVKFKIFDSVHIGQQSKYICDRYFLPEESCARVSAAASNIFGSANLVGSIPINLGGFNSKLHLYDSMDCESQAREFCTRQYLSVELCEVVINKAMELFSTASVAGLLPINVGQGPIDLKLYHGHSFAAQIDSFCSRNLVSETSCQEMRNLVDTATAR